MAAGGPSLAVCARGMGALRPSDVRTRRQRVPVEPLPAVTSNELRKARGSAARSWRWLCPLRGPGLSSRACLSPWVRVLSGGPLECEPQSKVPLWPGVWP